MLRHRFLSIALLGVVLSGLSLAALLHAAFEAAALRMGRLIVCALERAGGNRSEAARQLGIGRPQLYAKMEEHGIAGPGPRGDGPSG